MKKQILTICAFIAILLIAGVLIFNALQNKPQKTPFLEGKSIKLETQIDSGNSGE